MRIYLGLSGSCNLRCRYCYREEPRPEQCQSLSAEHLRRAIQLLRQKHNPTDLTFVLHGYEPLLPGALYLSRLLGMLSELAPGSSTNIQTNLTLMDRETAGTIRRYAVTVGTSIDGPPDIHDATRPGMVGAASLAGVLRGVAVLREADITPSVICVVSRQSLNRERDIYEFFKAQKLSFTI